MRVAWVFLAEMQLAGALMRRVGVFLAEMQLAGAHRCVMAVRAVAQKHREEASGKRVQDWQLGAWLANACRATFVWVVRLGGTSCLLLPLGRQGFGAVVYLWRRSGRGEILLL